MKSYNGIMKGFKKTIKQLTALENVNNNLQIDVGNQIRALTSRSEILREEAERCSNTARKLNELIE